MLEQGGVGEPSHRRDGIPVERPLWVGDIVYIELPKVGTKFGKHDVFGTIEAVKAVSELFAPIAGEVVAINERLDKEPALVNTEPYGAGWMIKVKPTNPSDLDALLSSADYKKHIGQ